MTGKEAKAVALSERIDLIERAIYRAGWTTDNRLNRGAVGDDYYIQLVYDTYAIVCNYDSVHFRVDFTETADGIDVQPMAEWTRVEKEWAAKAVADNTLVSFGGAIKALGDDGKIAGYLVLFTDAESPDLYGDYFTSETDFDITDGQKTTLYYQHGLDATLKRRKIGTGTLTKTDVGIWLDGQLALRDDYEKAIFGMVKDGKQGLSSGTAAHLVERVVDSQAAFIRSWPLGLDASLTPTPAEPRTSVMPLKSFLTTQDEPQADAQAVGDTAAPATAKTAPAVVIQPITETTTMTTAPAVDPAIKAINDRFDAIEAVLKRFAEEPALQNAGHVTQDGGTKDKGIKTFADFLTAVKRQDIKRLGEVYGVRYIDADENIKSVNEASGSDGGYTVPAEFLNQLMQVASGINQTVRPRAYRQPMRSKSISIPALDQTQTPTPGVNSPLLAGVAAYWTAEEADSTESDPTFSMINLGAFKFSGHTKASNEMLADGAVALEALLIKLFGDAVGFSENWAFLRGNGVGKPLGVLNAAAKIAVTRAASGNNFELADALGMLKRFLRTSRASAVWVMHPFLEVELVSLALAGNTLVTYMPNLADAIPLRLFGIPVVFDDAMSVPGTAGDVGLFDFSYYLLGDRQMMTVAMSEHADFTKGRVVWRFEHRVGGTPWLRAPITLADSTNTVSPFVTLT